MNFNKSKIYIVGTPIGNITDITQNAISTIKKANIIATENIQKLYILLKNLHIEKKIIIKINKINEITLSYKIVQYIKNEKSIAIISDAGMPLISDPGFFLVNYASKNNIKTVIIPGISVLTSAISNAHLNVKMFTFNGFMPKTIEKKYIKLSKIKNMDKVNIFFDSPKRIVNTISLISTIINQNNKLILIKDLTKKFSKNLIMDTNYIIKRKMIKFFTRGEITLFLKKNKELCIYTRHIKIIKKKINTYKRIIF